MWSKAKDRSKAGFDKLYGVVDKLGAPVNRLSNKLGAEAFWPTTLDKESDKAARILQSFCKDGFYQEEDRPSTDGPKSKQRVLKKIPTDVIRKAKGLAIFTTMRTGLWVSGAGGSGILVGRKEDGTWSPPSGIMLHTAGLGFLVGVDIYDCVVVINTQEALNAFTKVRCTLGGEVSAVAGPVGVGGVLDSEVHKRQAPIFTYLKSRGFYAGVQIDGTIIIERTDENERFYGQRIGVGDILAGKVRHVPYETRTLMETIKAAQGDTNLDQSLLPQEPSPGDFDIVDEQDEKAFGIPDKEDPDPFGVLALEQAGLEIKEAGTDKRPTSEEFEFRPSPTSPIYTTFRRSIDRSSLDGRSTRRSSWRTSTISTALEQPRSKMVDTSTQTDDLPLRLVVPPPLPPRSVHNASPTMKEIPEDKSTDEARSKQDTRQDSPTNSRPGTAGRESVFFHDDDAEDEPIIQEVQQAAAPQSITRARIVTVAKPTPPKLPPRNPFRARLSVHSDISNDDSSRDVATAQSPVAGPNPSPPSTPSLRDVSSASSQDSIASEEDHLDRISTQLQPKLTNEPEKTEEKSDFDSVTDSPAKNIPGGFH